MEAYPVNLFTHVTSLFNVVSPLTFKLLIHVIACDNCLTTTYDNADDVVIFAGVGSIPKSPHNGVENSLVLIFNAPLSNNKVGLSFNSSCLKYSPETGALLYNGG